ncbi:MAG TPA: DUF1778 domain-containing protein [Solirubrobacteraceae bacterium]|nr:DUF1778 domain-containing protein [Solirubrobacteraceae bacterium]
MAAKSDRLDARLTSAQRLEIERAATLASESVSSFVVTAAVQRAEALVAEHSSTVVPPAYFDRLVASLDEPDEAPGLARAVRKARRRKRIRAA